MYPHEHTTIFRFSPPCYEHILLKITTYRNKHSLYNQLYPPSHEKKHLGMPPHTHTL